MGRVHILQLVCTHPKSATARQNSGLTAAGKKEKRKKEMGEAKEKQFTEATRSTSRALRGRQRRTARDGDAVDLAAVDARLAAADALLVALQHTMGELLPCLQPPVPDVGGGGGAAAPPLPSPRWAKGLVDGSSQVGMVRVLWCCALCDRHPNPAPPSSRVVFAANTARCCTPALQGLGAVCDIVLGKQRVLLALLLLLLCLSLCGGREAKAAQHSRPPRATSVPPRQHKPRIAAPH